MSVIYVPLSRWQAKHIKRTPYHELKEKYLNLRIEASGKQQVIQDLMKENRELRLRLASLGY